MTQHPAHQLARMAADAAGELRGYTDPADPFPWELSEDDHRAILPRLHNAIAHLAVCIDGIAQATGDEHAKRQLAEGVGRLLSGCAHVKAAGVMLTLPGGEPDAEPAITSALAPMTRHQAVHRWLDDVTRKIGETHMETGSPGGNWRHPPRPAGRQPPGQAGASAARGTDPGRLRLPWQAALPHPSNINLIQINEDHILTIVDYSGGGCLRCL